MEPAQNGANSSDGGATPYGGAKSSGTGRDIPGAGLVKGLVTTFKTMTHKAHTVQYPDQSPELPPRTRGVIALIEENCTVCMLCARECPDWCIYIDSHKETIPAPPSGGRERARNVLDRFAIDFSLCMYCGICIEVCPFDALEWSPEFEYAELDIKDLLHEKDRLREWFWTVPAPVALDPAAEDPKEIAVAAKAADKMMNARKAAEIVALAEGPAEATETTKSVQPSGTTKSVQPSGTTESVQSSETTQQAQPTQPTQSTQPTEHHHGPGEPAQEGDG